ncbi:MULTISPECIES: FAD-binding protein [Streptomyces]|uniref:FAD-binding protein n=1 Tax=Streptomyces ramulosus TaxID=47762 RepID=A0ABW1FEP7_9ACTN
MYDGGKGRGYDRAADVVVVGYGGAGAVAAATACDAGAHVLLVEKQPADRRRPSTRLSGGLFLVPHDTEAAARYLGALSRFGLDGEQETDPAVIRAWAEETARTPAWLAERGATSVLMSDSGEHPTVDGHTSLSVHKPDMVDHPGGHHRGWGYGLFDFLSRQVTGRPVDVLHEASAQWLLTDAAGAVRGVQVRHRGREIRVRAGRATILTCGGFEFDTLLKRTYLKAHPTHFYGNPENTGDGIRMAQDVGADLWHMNACSGRLVARFPGSGYPGGCPVDLWAVEATPAFTRLTGGDRRAVPLADTEVAAPESVPGALVVDRYGRRYTSELQRLHTLYYELTDLDSHRLVHPKIPSWWVFDSRRMAAGPLVPGYAGPTGPLREIRWDNDDAVRRGWVRTAGTAAGLAARCGMDPDELTRTMTAYNADCARGEDSRFARPPGMLTALDAPPYHAVCLWPGGPNTQGGPRRDAESRVMSVRGHPIPGLYAAGELGSVYGMLYPAGGANIAECLAFGRIAGHHAAGKRP